MKTSSLIVLLAAVAAFATTSSLGFWQLSRARQKTEWAEQSAQRRALPAVALSGQENAAVVDIWADRKVKVQGRWLEAQTVFLDNRQMNGRPGFYVMTPLRLEGQEQSVLVQRGWVARDFQDRMAVPKLESSAELQAVEGHIASHPAKLLELGAAQPGQIRQNLDLQAFAQEKGLRLLPFIIVQEGPDSEGLRRQWPAIDSGVQKHHGYAFQWFGLSALWVVLYVWFQIIVPRKKRASA